MPIRTGFDATEWAFSLPTRRIGIRLPLATEVNYRSVYAGDVG